MIVGSGLLARSFSPAYARSAEVVIYAAGVSNSSCTDPREFERERIRVLGSLEAWRDARTFVYFSTCSILDPDLADKPYVLHKGAMEQLVKTHAGHMVIRLPQLAGRSPNPHTLLNYLYARISRSERFLIWGNAARNIIDVDDVVKVARHIIDTTQLTRDMVNIANIDNYPVRYIVSTMERVCGKNAVCDVVERGTSYSIDVQRMLTLLPAVGVKFGPDYLSNALRKYYG